jgi:hypothetical protein
MSIFKLFIQIFTWLLAIGIFSPATSAITDFPQKINDKRCTVKGDTVRIVRDSVWLIDNTVRINMVATDKKNDSLRVLMAAKINAADSILIKYQGLSVHYTRLDSLQKATFDSLEHLQRNTDELLSRSIRNTEKAVRQSCLTSALLGGIAGFLATKDQELRWQVSGPLIGIFAGWGITRLLMK